MSSTSEAWYISPLLNISGAQLKSGHPSIEIFPPPDPDQEGLVLVDEGFSFHPRSDLGRESYSHNFRPMNLNSSLKPS